ncbi:unnamed protein product, partial [Coregonus sp. 'balchen']
MPGGSVNLTCVAVGSPMPYVKWIMGEIELTKESANYTCVAISSLGMIEATAQVSIKEYEFRVMAVNNIGRGPPSDPVETRTGEQAPSSPPLAVQVRMLSASTMLVQWEPPEEPNGQIRGYRVYYNSDMDAPLSGWQKHNTDDSRLTTISGLTTDITYSLRVLGFTSVGDGPPSEILQPSSFEAEAELDTRIMLTWLWPVQDSITKYELQYWEGNSDNKIHVTFNPVGSYAVEGLKPDTLYRFSLAARSEFGLGVYTQPIEARTAQSREEEGEEGEEGEEEGEEGEEEGEEEEGEEREEGEEERRKRERGGGGRKERRERRKERRERRKERRGERKERRERRKERRERRERRKRGKGRGEEEGEEEGGGRRGGGKRKERRERRKEGGGEGEEGEEGGREEGEEGRGRRRRRGEEGRGRRGGGRRGGRRRGRREEGEEERRRKERKEGEEGEGGRRGGREEGRRRRSACKGTDDS